MQEGVYSGAPSTRASSSCRISTVLFGKKLFYLILHRHGRRLLAIVVPCYPVLVHKPLVKVAFDCRHPGLLFDQSKDRVCLWAVDPNLVKQVKRGARVLVFALLGPVFFPWVFPGPHKHLNIFDLRVRACGTMVRVIIRVRAKNSFDMECAVRINASTSSAVRACVRATHGITRHIWL